MVKFPFFSRHDFSGLGVGLLVAGGFLSYAELELSPLKILAYCLSLVGLLSLVVGDPRVSRPQVFLAGIFCFGIATSNLVGGLVSTSTLDAARIVQELLYPLILFVGTLFLFRVRSVPKRGPQLVILILGITNFCFALLGSFGLLRAIPIFGPMEIGRYVFGTTVPSASGLAFNVNYFAVTQSSLFWMYGLISERGKPLSRFDLLALFLLGMSSNWGSSRGVLLSLAFALVVIKMIVAWGDRTRSAAAARIWLFGGLFAVVLGVVAIGDQLYDAFRLYKGLNMRDELWERGMALWLERPIFGWGLDFQEGQRYIGGALSEGRSLHSGFLNTLVRGGLVTFVSSFGLLFFSVFWGLGKRRELWVHNRWAVGAITFYLVNTTFRTYSLGGIGLLPIVAATGISICLHARWSELKSSNQSGPVHGTRNPHPADGVDAAGILE